MRSRKTAVIFLISLLLSSCALLTEKNVESRLLVYQVKFPKNIVLNGNYTFHWVKESSISSRPFKQTMFAADGTTEDSIGIEKGFKGLFLVESGDRYSQGFNLDIPYNPDISDWTEWIKPDFISKTQRAHFALCYGQSIDRIKELPPDTVELRFRIIKDERVNKKLCECLKKRKK